MDPGPPGDCDHHNPECDKAKAGGATYQGSAVQLQKLQKHIYEQYETSSAIILTRRFGESHLEREILLSW
jgi:hypothetical protein